MESRARKYYAFFGSLIAWVAVITQFVLLMQNTKVAEAETVIRFFSYFTILTNLLVASYFTAVFIGCPFQRIFPYRRAGFLTATTLYITVVSLVYQIVLRPLWSPKGLQFVVDETLHSVVPIMTIIFWALYEKKKKVRWSQIPGWLIYPLAYFFYIMIRGGFSGFYPYPFVNVDQLGMDKVLLNAVFLLILFALLGALYISIGKAIARKN
ncbi:MAG: Pr6Pr family membrane protein [Bacteroidales bacterium]|nr:Pr6Pr family membrane protein [Bacteroidales bacterium]